MSGGVESSRLREVPWNGGLRVGERMDGVGVKGDESVLSAMGDTVEMRVGEGREPQLDQFKRVRHITQISWRRNRDKWVRRALILVRESANACVRCGVGSGGSTPYAR